MEEAALLLSMLDPKPDPHAHTSSPHLLSAASILFQPYFVYILYLFDAIDWMDAAAAARRGPPGTRGPGPAGAATRGARESPADRRRPAAGAARAAPAMAPADCLEDKPPPRQPGQDEVLPVASLSNVSTAAFSPHCKIQGKFSIGELSRHSFLSFFFLGQEARFQNIALLFWLWWVKILTQKGGVGRGMQPPSRFGGRFRPNQAE
jgi:hypothetical protein